MTLALEQLKFLNKKFILNTILIVNGPLGIHSTYKQIGKPVYVYNKDIETILSKAESGTLMKSEIGLTIIL